MMDLAQADPTLRFTPRSETETLHANHLQRVKALREMSDKDFLDLIGKTNDQTTQIRRHYQSLGRWR